MKSLLITLSFSLALALLVGPAAAEIMNVEIVCTVDYTQASDGILAGVQPGDMVVATFEVDSDNYIDSTSYGVRSYIVDPSTFEMTAGSVGPIPLVIPQPDNATVYFVVRESDPVVDGFFLSVIQEWPWVFPSLDIPGRIAPYMGYHYEVDYQGNVLSTKDITQLAGTYGRTDMDRYYCAVNDDWADVLGLIYQMTTITSQTVPVENATWGDLKALYR